MPTATKLGRMLTYLNGLLPTKSDVLWSCGRVWSRDKLESLYLCYQSVYGHETWQDGNLPFLPMILHDPLFTWSCEITWQPKIIISPLP